MSDNLQVLLRLPLAMLLLLLYVSSATSLPWDTDMYRQESLKANEVVRSPVKGTIPLGYTPFTMSIEEAEKDLSNPLPTTASSLWAGRRIWNAQCAACHGQKGDSQTNIGTQMGAPNLLLDLYRERSDGRIFAVIYHGLRAMPRYGYKLSPENRWKVVNYLRYLQGKSVPGVQAPFPKGEKAEMAGGAK